MRKALLVVVALLISCLSTFAASAQTTAPAEVRMWIAFVDSRLDWTVAKAKEFNQKYPQFKVTIEGFSDYQPLNAAIDNALARNAKLADVPLAIAQIFDVGTQHARDLNVFKPVSEALGDRKELNGFTVNFEDIIRVITDYYSFDGKWQSMPWNTSTVILYANKDLMDATGITVAPRTWQELDADCAKIMARKIEFRLENCWMFPNQGWFMEQWIAQQGGLFANNNNGRTARATEVLLDSPEVMNAAQYLQDQAKKGYLGYTGVQSDYVGTETKFETGRTAFILSTSGDAKNIITGATANKINVVGGTMPHNEKTGWHGNIIGGASLWLVRGLDPKVEEGALTWMLFLTDTENAVDWHKTTGYIPIRRSAQDQLAKDGWFTTNHIFGVAGQQLLDSPSAANTSGAMLGTFSPTRNLVTQAIENIITKGADPVSTFKQVKVQADALLAQYNAPYANVK